MNKRVSNFEPRVTATDANYTSVLSRAFNYYNQELDKKDARAFIKSYLKNNQIVINYFDKIPDNKIILSYGWIARILENGNSITEKHLNKFNEYLNELKTFVPAKENEVVEAEKPNRPSIQDYMHEKIADVLGELEGALDDFIKDNKELDLYSYLTSNSVPKPYCTYIDAWARKSVQEYIAVYETDDAEIKEAYANLGRRKLAQIIKLFGSWVADIERYSQFKKANRKPRVKKAKPAGVQVAKLKFKKDLPELGLKSVIASEIVGASQVWVYNCKYKRLAVYRSDSSNGIQVKGSTLQNYEPTMCEQKSVRRPEIVLKKVLESSKVQLRKIISDLNTKDYELTGRINEECILLRVIK